MAIKQLSEEEIRTWSLEEKDRWWLEKVYKGDMPQLTLRSALTGFLLGGILSATNLYIGAKTGWSLGVGVTSVILAFAMFKVLSQIGLAREFTILENNAMQSIATAAGYMTAPLISSLTAYMIATNTMLAWHQILIWNVVLSILGVLFAFPMKRRFINDEQHPFPEGRAAGVVMDTLHSDDPAMGLVKAKALVMFGVGAALIRFLQAEAIHEWLQVKVLGLKHTVQHVIWTPWTSLFEREIFRVPAETFANLRGKGAPPVGVKPPDLSIFPEFELALFGAGGLMGIRAGVSLIIGAILNYWILVPLMISWGEIVPRIRDGAPAGFGLRQITLWAVWPGVACMVAATFVSFFAKPQVLLQSFQGMFGTRKDKSDILSHIELPMWVSIIGIPLLSLLAAVLAKMWFGVSIWLCLLGIPLTYALSLIAANSTALTSTTPVGATAKITQLFYGIVAPGPKVTGVAMTPALQAQSLQSVGTNLAMAGLTAEVVSNSSNLLMDIKPGYMLGAKPRQQAIGHVIGIFAGAIASTPLFFLLFCQNVDKDGIESIVSPRFPMPSVQVWRAVSEALTKGLSELPSTAVTALMAAALIGGALEVARIATRGKFPLSPIALGLAFVIDFNSSFAMFLGALVFWGFGVGRLPEEQAETSYVASHYEPICSGIIAGAALMGIADAIAAAFILPMYTG